VLALLLAAACAGHGPAAAELERCRDDDGSWVDCARSGPSWAFTAVPDEVAAPSRARADEAPAEVEAEVDLADPTTDVVGAPVQTELPEPEGEGCPPPKQGVELGEDIVGVLVADDRSAPTEDMIVGGIESGPPSLRDRALARQHRREERRIDREDRRAARKARRAAR
jgi:hypothetical protein